MTSVISNKAIILLMTLMEIAATIDGGEMMKDKCKKQQEECSIENECFSDSSGVQDLCDFIDVKCGVENRPDISLYAYERCSFSVDLYDRWQHPPNRTYSVFIGDTREGRNLKLVEDCCNLPEKSQCLMPPTEDKNKKFFVVFPYNEGRTEVFCYEMLEYNDAPIDECEKGKEIIDHCWDFIDGDRVIKYRYRLLDGRKELKQSEVHFTLPSIELPAYLTFTTETYTKVNKSFINVTCTGDDAMIGTRRISKCKVYHNVNSTTRPEIINKAYEPENGDLQCYNIVKVAGINYTPWFVVCKRMEVRPSNLIGIPIAAIGVSIAAFIIVVFAVRICRVLQTISKEKKAASVLKFMSESSDSDLEAGNRASHQIEESFEQNLDEFNDDSEQHPRKEQEPESLYLLFSSSTESISRDNAEQISSHDGEISPTGKKTDDAVIMKNGYILKEPLIATSPEVSPKRVGDKSMDTKLNVGVDVPDYNSGYIPKYLTTN